MPIHDKFHHFVQKLIDKEQPKTMEELQQLLDSLVGQQLPDIPEQELTEEDQALELVWEAYELPVDKGRRRAQKALKLYPDCIEAYEYLGNSYSYYHKCAPFFEKGVAIGRDRFGGEYLKQNKNHFWGLTETRPFMRCLAMLAECYYGPGQTARAIPLWEELIELNPNDNQGIRYVLLAALLEVKDLKKYQKYRKMYSEESTLIVYSDALFQFMQKGDSPAATATLKSAFKMNKHVPPLMLATYPPDAYPDSYSWGSKEEALIYLKYAWRAWLWAEGAKDWLGRQFREAGR